MSDQNEDTDPVVVRDVALEHQAESQEVVEEVLPELDVVSLLDELINDLLEETADLNEVEFFDPTESYRSWEVGVSRPAFLFAEEKVRHDWVEEGKSEDSRDRVV